MKTALACLPLLLACGGAVTDPGATPLPGPARSADGGASDPCVSETLSNDVVDADRLTTFGAIAFWNTNDGRLVRHDATGNTVIASVAFTSMVADADDVYGTTLDAVVAVPRSGGAPVTLARDRALSLVLVDDTLFYVAEDAKAIVSYGPLHGAPVRTIVAQSAENPYTLAVDDGSVYFESDTSAPYRVDVWQASRSGGSSPVQLTTTHELTDIAVSGGALYYADGDDEVTSGVFAVTGPGSSRTVVPLANVDTLGLVVDPNGAVGYYAVADAVPKPAYHGRIYRFALDGTSSTLIADVGADTLVANIKPSSDALYFTTLSGVEETIGTVQKTCK